VCLLNEINRLDDCLDKPISLPDFRILLCEQNEFSASRMHHENLAFDLLNHSFSINENLRYKVNYILNRKGDIRIETLCAELGISRQALHKSFKDGLGIGPKDLAKTWRLNH